MKMHISLEHNRMKASLAGYMYVEDASLFREEAIKKMGEQINSIDIDMRELEFIDSAGLGVLISLYKRCVKRGGTMVLRNLQGNVKEIFSLTRLDQVFTLE